MSQSHTWHIDVTWWSHRLQPLSHRSHTHMIQWNDIEGSKDNNVI